MFARLAVFAVLATAVLAAVTPVADATCADDEVQSQCSEIVLSTDPTAIDLLGMANITVGNIDTAIGIGIDCSFPTVSSRDSETVCCATVVPLLGLGVDCASA